MRIDVDDATPCVLDTPEHVAELERLGDQIAELSAHLEAATARLLDLIREFDARGGWGNGFRSCAAWLSWRVGLDLGAAREKVRVARALRTLPRLAGQARALGLALTGEPLTAERAEAWGLIWKVVDDDKLADETGALAAKFAAAPTKGLAATKKLIRESGQRTLDTQLDIERDAQRALGHTSDYKEGVAAFMEKRPPKFSGS